MQFNRLVPAGLAALAAAAPLGAQNPGRAPGTLEVGLFGQFTSQADTFGIENPPAFGARVGAFFTPRVQLEGDFSYGTADQKDVPDPVEGQYSTLALRVNYNIPFGLNNAFILGGGVVRSNYKFDLDDDDDVTDIAGDAGPFLHHYGASGLVGLRYGIGPVFALRVDGIAEYHPTPEAFNLTGRAGLSFLLPGSQPMTASEAMGTMGVSQPGTLELGLFGNFPIFASEWGLQNTFGGGARAGVFITPRLQIEADAAYSEADLDEGSEEAAEKGLTDESYNYNPIAARLNYNIPFGNRTAFILGAGAVRSHYQYVYNYGASGLAGLRFALANRFALRADVVGNYMPEPSAFDVNLRAGFSAMVGGAQPAEEVIAVVPTPEPTPEPAPPPPPPPPPPPVDTLGPRIEAARAALTAEIYFAFDRADIDAAARAILDAKIPILRANPDMRIRIVGNTDERGSDEYNLALGQRRAAAAQRYLVQQGIEAGRFETVSRGEENPVVPNATTEEEHARNRRDEFVIIVGGDNITLPPQQ